MYNISVISKLCRKLIYTTSLCSMSLVGFGGCAFSGNIEFDPNAFVNIGLEEGEYSTQAPKDVVIRITEDLRTKNLNEDEIRKRFGILNYEAIEHSDPNATLFLAGTLIEGVCGVKAHPAYGFEVLRRACVDRNPVALTLMGTHLLDGTPPLTKDIDLGINYLKTACQLGFAGAADTLSNVYTGTCIFVNIENDECARKYLQIAADADYPNSMLILARAYIEGRYGIEKDYQVAQKLYNRILGLQPDEDKDQIMADLEADLSTYHYYGLYNFERDIPLALNYLNNAADKKHIGAMLDLGWLMLIGVSGRFGSVEKGYSLIQEAEDLIQNVKFEKYRADLEQLNKIILEDLMDPDVLREIRRKQFREKRKGPRGTGSSSRQQKLSREDVVKAIHAQREKRKLEIAQKEKAFKERQEKLRRLHSEKLAKAERSGIQAEQNLTLPMLPEVAGPSETLAVQLSAMQILEAEKERKQKHKQRSKGKQRAETEVETEAVPPQTKEDKPGAILFLSKKGHETFKQFFVIGASSSHGFSEGDGTQYDNTVSIKRADFEALIEELGGKCESGRGRGSHEGYKLDALYIRDRIIDLAQRKSGTMILPQGSHNILQDYIVAQVRETFLSLGYRPSQLILFEEGSDSDTAPQKTGKASGGKKKGKKKKKK